MPGRLCNANPIHITSLVLLQVSPSQASVKGLLATCQQAAPALRDLAEELAAFEAATQQQVIVQRHTLRAACEHHSVIKIGCNH